MADQGNDKRGAPKELPKPEPPGYFEGESMTRRTAFTIAVQAIGGLAGAAIVLPAIGFAVAPIFEQEKEPWQAVGPDRRLQPGHLPAGRLHRRTEGIGETGKTTAYVRQGNPRLPANQTRYPKESRASTSRSPPAAPTSAARSASSQAAGNFICPCHGGVYDFHGKRIGGPPVRPLDRFQTRVTNGQVEVGPRYSVTNQLEPVRARDPGEFTGGIWKYLYPPRPSVPPPP